MNDDEPEMIAKRIAYIDHIRGMHKNKRVAGVIGCLLGVIVLAWSRFRAEAPPWGMWVGLGVIAASWILFVYVIVSRTSYVRTHPFDPGA